MSFNRPHPSVKFQAFVFKFIDDLPDAERLNAEVYWQEESAVILAGERAFTLDDTEPRAVYVKSFVSGARWGTLDS